MKIKKLLRITAFLIAGILLLCSLFLGYSYYKHRTTHSRGQMEYSHYVGYIAPNDKVQLEEDFSLCGTGKLIGYYHSAAPKIYNGSKHQFRKYLLSNYRNKAYKDTGMLNLRFHINCKRELGDLEINELDNDYNKSKLTADMVDQLVKLIARPENWSSFANEDYNYYMYLNIRIEDGDITEIIP